MRHRLKGHTYNSISGRMAVFERYFNSLEEAVAYATSQNFDHFKVFDNNEQLVVSQTPTAEGTYA